MAIGVRSHSLAGNSGAGTIAVPTGTQNGDLLLAWCITDPDGAVTDLTAPGDWTQIASDATAIRGRIFYKVASGESGTYAFGTSAGSDGAWVIVAFTGVDTTTPIQVNPVISGGTAATDLVAPSITMTGAGALVCCYGSQNAGTFTTPSGMTEIADHSPGGWAAQSICWESRTSGATGTRTSTHSVSEMRVWASLGLNEAGGGGGGPTFPTIATNNTTASASTSSPLALNMPTGIVAGDLLVAFAANDVGSVNMSMSGWTELYDTRTGTAARGSCYAKIAAGGDTGSIVKDAQDLAAVVVRITDHGVTDPATEIFVATPATGTSTTPNPPSLNTGASAAYLWIEHFAADDDDETATYWSTGYTGVAQVESAQSTSSCMCSVAFKQAEAQTEDPGTMAMSASEEWTAGTIAIPPSTGLSAAVGVASETDAALAVAKRKGVGTASETDTGQPVHKRKVIGLAATTDTALAVSRKVIAFRDSTSSVQDTTVTAHAITVPATVQVDDLLLVIYAVKNDGAPTPPAGWTLIDQHIAPGSTDVGTSAYYRVAQAGDAGTQFTWTSPVAATGTLALVAWSGTDASGTPITGSLVDNSATSTSTPTSATITGTGGLDVAAVAVRGTALAGAGPTFTPPSGYTERVDVTNAPANELECAITVAESVTIDPTVGKTFTASASCRPVGLRFLIPGASVPPPPVLTHAMSGAVTDTTAVVAVKGDLATTVDVTVAPGGATASDTLDADGYGKVSLTGLTAGTVYTYTVELDGTEVGTGTFKTFPTAGSQSSFNLVFGSCMQSPLVDPNVFEHMPAHVPLMLIQLGDFHYENPGANDQGAVRGFYQGQINDPVFGDFLRDTPIAYMYDNHDWGGEDSHATSPAAPAVKAVYRQVFPHYTLVGDVDGCANQTWVIGRVRFLLIDNRSQRDPGSDLEGPSKTMLGANQKAWLKGQLLNATELVKVICIAFPWQDVGTDRWASYTDEFNELNTYITTNGITGVYAIGGDNHSICADNGTNNSAGIPNVIAATFDQTNFTTPGTWSQGTATVTHQQYGLLEFTDAGSSITVDFTGWAVDPVANTESSALTMQTVFTANIVTPVGLAVETDTAQAVTRVKRLAVGVAAETDTAVTVEASSARSVALASETDTALGVAKRKGVTLAAETDVAQAVGKRKRKGVGLAAEADTAFAVAKRKSVAPAAETDAALAVGRAKRLAVGVAIEIDTGRAVHKRKGVGLAVGTETAFSVATIKRLTAGFTSESDTAQAVAGRKVKVIGLAAEVDTAGDVSPPIPVDITVTVMATRVASRAVAGNTRQGVAAEDTRTAWPTENTRVRDLVTVSNARSRDLATTDATRTAWPVDDTRTAWPVGDNRMGRED